MDFEKYKLRHNLKSMCMWEAMTNRPYSTVGEDEEDILTTMYCCLLANNDDLLMDYSTFKVLVGDKKIFKWMTKQYMTLQAYTSQFKAFTSDEDDDTSEDGNENPNEPIRMTDLAASFIMQHKLDPHYVMNELEIWQIKPLVQCADNVYKAQMAEKRFWAYLQISPHIDGKKIKKPEQIVSFPWEGKMLKKKREDYLKNNIHAIHGMIGKTFDWIK